MSEQKDPRELLAMCAPKVQHFALAPGGGHLDGIDIAHALAGVADPYARLYARVKYMGQWLHAEELALSLRRRVAIECDIGNWRIPTIKYPNGITKPRKNFILDMCMLALSEDFKPSLCLWCAGEGRHITETGAYKSCDACKGSGYQRVLGVDRANILNIAPQSWSQTWAPRYQNMQGIVGKWDSKVKGTLEIRLALVTPP